MHVRVQKLAAFPKQDRFASQGRKIRLLALHGFRENAERFRGRLRGLLKRMGPLVDVDFVTAPHELKQALQHTSEAGANPPITQRSVRHEMGTQKYGWFKSGEHGQGNC